MIYGKYTMLDFSFAVRIQYVKSDALIRRPGHERFGSSHIQPKIFNWFVVITFNLTHIYSHLFPG